MKRSRKTSFIGWPVVLTVILISLFLISACKPAVQEKEVGMTDLSIQANLVFFYYKDLDSAVEFYERTLGLEEVLDYGFAKIFRISETSYIGLVDETGGMHTTAEPKTATLSFITDEVETWFEYLSGQGVEIHRPLSESSRIPIKGFVAKDPEGYLLEFETFRPHPQNEKILESLTGVNNLYRIPATTDSPSQDKGIRGNILWLYYKDLAEAQRFYEDIMGLELLVDQGFAKVYSSSKSGFIGLVDAAQGLHGFTETKSVNVAFTTRDVELWYEHLLDRGLEMRDALDYAEGDRIKAFVTYDPAGYFLEFHWIMEHSDNRKLLEILNQYPNR
ncbi:VOC family protein [Acidobacteriota bacterium]